MIGAILAVYLYLAGVAMIWALHGEKGLTIRWSGTLLWPVSILLAPYLVWRDYR
jgi:hypothetical protein